MLGDNLQIDFALLSQLVMKLGLRFATRKGGRTEVLVK